MIESSRLRRVVRLALALTIVTLSLVAVGMEQNSLPAAPVMIGLVVATSLLVVVDRLRRPSWLTNELPSPGNDLCNAAQAIVDATPGPALIADRLGRILYQNGADQSLFGKASFLDRWRSRIEDARAVSQAFAAARDLQAWFGWTTILDRFGNERNAAVEITPIVGRNGSADIILITQAIDSSTYQSMTSAMSSIAREPMFLANVSHEIRTPLTSMLGFTDALIDDLEKCKASTDSISAACTIKRNGQHLLSIVNDILDLSKSRSAKMKVDRRPCRLQDITREIGDLFHQRFAEKNIAFEIVLGRFLPPVINTDATRLKQIMMNLIGNALKFTQQGKVKVSLELPPDNPRSLAISVEDTGMGMSTETLSKLFNPFVQGDGIKQKFGGTGLGLTISKTLAQALGGDIQVESQPGIGSKFTATVEIGSIDGIPLTVTPAGYSVDRKRTWNEAIKQVPRGLRILAVEDSVDNRNLLGLLFKKIDANVTFAVDGSEAVEAHRQAMSAGTPFDLILMDIELPIMSGHEATRMIRHSDLQTPILAFTAHVLAGDAKTCLQVGCNDYIGKPIDREGFYSTIARYAPKPRNITANESQAMAEPALS